MNNQGEIVLDFGDGTYKFRLTVLQLIELEEKCNAAFAVTFARLTNGIYTVNDVLETLRLGLIGGGTDAVNAKKLVDRYALPMSDNWQIARAIMAAAMFGFESSPMGKAQAAATHQNGSTPPNSSAMPNSSGSIPMGLDEFHSGSWLQ